MDGGLGAGNLLAKQRPIKYWNQVCCVTGQSTARYLLGSVQEYLLWVLHISGERAIRIDTMKIAVIDDDRALCRSLQIHLQRMSHEVQIFFTGAEGLHHLLEGNCELAFVDLNLPDTTGLEILRAFKDSGGKTLTVMITAVQDSKSTIDAVRLGAFDYVRKPLDLDAVMLTVEKAKQLRCSLAQRHSEPMAVPIQPSPYEIIGAHPSIIEVLKQVALVADSHVPVLIQGETGTGKELVARALHNACSPGAPFVAVNCSAVVATLLESELFGHVKGAFTGADSNKIGKLEAAGNGTIFFDEIGDMSYDLQAKLLRVLQEKEFERVGSTNPIAFHARVVAATHRDLQLLVAGNEFREDLYYRLAVSTIRVPSLRDRRSDIPALVQSILERITQELHKDIAGLDKEAIQSFIDYDWPGNIRELSNVVTRAILLARTPVISKEVALASMGKVQPANVFSEGIKPLREAERDYVLKALISTGWNIMRTATLLDISRVTLRKKIEDYGLSKSSLEN